MIEATPSLGDLRVSLPNIEAYFRASDKFDLLRLASELNVSIPATEFIDQFTMESVCLKRDYPLVFKPALSQMPTSNGIRSTRVQVVDDENQLRRILEESPWLESTRALLQQFVTGTGQGIFSVYDSGRPLGFFGHRRLREKPPQGGVSVLSESCIPREDMKNIAESLLTELNWHGAAMVEFKVSNDGTPYLMEINGRPWGSMQLAINSGFDVPNILVELATGITAPAKREIRSGVRNRWLMGDLDHLLLQLAGKGTATSWRQKIRAIFAFLNFFDPKTRLEVFRWHDIRPFMYEIRLWISELLNLKKRPQ